MNTQYYIVNTYDRPDSRHIAEERDGKLYYVHPYLKNEKAYHGMESGNKVPLEDFGIRVLVKNGKLYGTLVDPSTATYADGRPRKWQGEPKFSFTL